METGHCFSSSSSGAKYYLTGGFAPVPDEMTAFDLPVEGASRRSCKGAISATGRTPLSATPATGSWAKG